MGPLRCGIRVRLGTCVMLLALLSRGGFAAEDSPALFPSADLTRLSLEDLMNIEVTSVSKQKQKIADAPAAVYVITQEDIRRSGLTSIPELLRLAPGLDVTQIDASRWAISARGFNSFYANELLVLVDGRSVYRPLFGGVLWDTVDYVLEDIDRIEVIRGPGSAMWGANAVNGVINIVTRTAKDTQGGLATGLLGNEERIGAVRYGGKLDDQTYYRAYAKYRNEDAGALADGSDANDDWSNLRGGFRIDRFASPQDLWTLQGDLYQARAGETATLPTFVAPYSQTVNNKFYQSGGNVLGRWSHNEGSDSEIVAQFYYDQVARSDLISNSVQDILNADVQHRFQLSKRQQITWGAAYRYMMDDIQPTAITTFDPERRDTYLASMFVQDRFTLVPNRLFLFAGAEIEVNSYSGFEVQPSVRGLWTPNDHNSVWLAVSRAVRTPSRFEEDCRATFAHMPTGLHPPFPQVASVESVGSEDFQSEGLIAWELGYRVKATSTLSIDMAAFVNRYDHLRSFERGTVFTQATPVPHMVQPLDIENMLYGESYGAEIAANWNVRDNWRLMVSYTWLDVQLHSNSSRPDLLTMETGIEGRSPINQFSIRSYCDITRNLELNTALYYVDNVPFFDVPAYWRLDMGIIWRIKNNLELSVVGQNLLDDRHGEFGSDLAGTPSEAKRAVYTQLAWRF